MELKSHQIPGMTGFEYPATTREDTLKAADHWDILADEQARGITVGVVDPVAGAFRIQTYRQTARELRAGAEG